MAIFNKKPTFQSINWVRNFQATLNRNGKPPQKIARALSKNAALSQRVNIKLLGSLLGPPNQRADRKIAYLNSAIDDRKSLEWAYFLYVMGEREKSDDLVSSLIASGPTPSSIRAKRFKYFTDHRWEPTQDEGNIPVIYQFWDKEIPTDVDLEIQKWRDLFGPNHHKLFNEEESRDLVRDHCGADKVATWDKTWSPAMKADLFRLIALHRFGGVYVDADLGTRPNSGTLLRQLSGENFVYSMTTSVNLRITNMLLGANAGWDVLAQTADRAFHEIEAGAKMSILALTGPWLLTNVALEIGQGETKALSNSLVRGQIVRATNPAYKNDDQYWKKQSAKRAAMLKSQV